MINKMKTALFTIVSLILLTSFKHEGPSYDTKPRYVMDKLGTQIAKEYDLKFLSSGMGLFADSKISLWGLNYMSSEFMTLEEVKPIAADISYRMLYLIYHNPLFANYYEEATTTRELDDNSVAFKIAFWDENVNRPLYPNIATVIFRDSNLYFFYADPKTQALQDPIIVPIKDLGLPSYK